MDAIAAACEAGNRCCVGRARGDEGILEFFGVERVRYTCEDSGEHTQICISQAQSSMTQRYADNTMDTKKKKVSVRRDRVKSDS